jgi:hypothetical protein
MYTLQRIYYCVHIMLCILTLHQEDLSSAVTQQLSSKAAEQELSSKLQVVEAKLSKTEAELAAVQKKVSLVT